MYDGRALELDPKKEDPAVVKARLYKGVIAKQKSIHLELAEMIGSYVYLHLNELNDEDKRYDEIHDFLKLFINTINVEGKEILLSQLVTDAAFCGDIKMLDIFLNLGVDVNIDGGRALYYALYHKKFDAVDFLLKKNADLMLLQPLDEHFGSDLFKKGVEFYKKGEYPCQNIE